MANEKDVSPLADNETDNDSEGTKKPGGLGDDGTIPASSDGVAAGHTGTSSHFNAEEDEAAE